MLHIAFFIKCRPHIHQHIHHTQKVGTFVEQISDHSCVWSSSFEKVVVKHGCNGLAQIMLAFYGVQLLNYYYKNILIKNDFICIFIQNFYLDRKRNEKCVQN